METNDRRWSTEIQVHYPLITEVALSPDGRWVVYGVREPLMTENRSVFITHLYLASASGGEPIQLTSGAHHNHTARWSPDGNHLAFLSNRGDASGEGKANIYVMRLAGGEPWPLTAYTETAVTDVVWAPDGQYLTFLMPEPPTEEKQRARKAKADPLIWGEDFDFQHVYNVPFAVAPRDLPEAIQVTQGPFHVVKLAWMPGGERLVLVHRPTPEEEAWTESVLALLSFMPDRIRNLPADETALEELATLAEWSPTPIPSPDGRWIACLTGMQPPRWGGANRVVLYAADGGEMRPLMETPDGQCWPIGWGAEGRAVYVAEQCGIDTHIWALSAADQTGRAVLTTPTYKGSLHTADRGRIAFVAETFLSPNALYLWDSASGDVQQVAAPSMPDDWPAAPVPDIEVLRWTSPVPLKDTMAQEGAPEIEGIVFYPPDRPPGQVCPLVVDVHGGPAGVFQRRFLGGLDRYCNIPALAELGIAVLRVNPRGSSGYGRTFRFANYKDWGRGDFADILAGVDLLVKQGQVDAERLGIMGWSYGGYMTSWAITQTDRFDAACVGAGVTNLMSFTGTADIPGFLPDYFGAEFWEDLDTYRSHSALFNVRGVTTPTLIQHGESDVRVPLSQGRELYTALKRQGVPVRMVIYPRQGHSVNEPRLRSDVRQRPVAWFARWLLDEVLV